MRSTWTDSRLDDLANRVDAGFARVDQDLRELRTEIVAMHRLMIQLGGGVIAALIGLIAALVVTSL